MEIIPKFQGVLYELYIYYIGSKRWYLQSQKNIISIELDDFGEQENFLFIVSGITEGNWKWGLQ